MRVGSLCTGYGGLDLAVHAVLGGEMAWLCEFDAAPAQVCEVRFPGVPNLHDLTALDWSDVPPVDVLTAGYPCQPFSHAGARKGTDDHRHLWPYIADAVRVLRPRLIVLENVAGHLSLGFDVVLGDLARLGFAAEWCVVRASDVGACHGRARLFIVASDARGVGRVWWPSLEEPELEGEHRLQAERSEGDGQFAGSGGATPDTSSHEPERRRAVGVVAGTEGEGGGEAPERQWVRDAAVDRGEDASDPTGVGSQGDRPRGLHIAGSRHQASVLDGSSDAPAHADVSGSEARDGRQGSGDAGRLQPVVGRDTVAPDADDAALNGEWARPEPGSGGPWGDYDAAISLHEQLVGRQAPRPVDDRGRLDPLFVEWMMCLPEGWVTDVLRSRAKALKCLGNGVVPPQAAYALTVLLGRMEAQEAA